MADNCCFSLIYIGIKQIAPDGNRRLVDATETKGAKWGLELANNLWTLKNHQGISVVSFEDKETSSFVVLPNWWLGFKYLNIRCLNGELVCFEPEKAVVEAIRSHLQNYKRDHASSFAKNHLKFAFFCSAIGILLLTVGATLYFLGPVESWRGKPTRMLRYGLGLQFTLWTGLAGLVTAVYQLRQAWKYQSIAKKQSGREKQDAIIRGPELERTIEVAKEEAIENKCYSCSARATRQCPACGTFCCEQHSRLKYVRSGGGERMDVLCNTCHPPGKDLRRAIFWVLALILLIIAFFVSQ